MWLTWIMFVTLALRESSIEVGCYAALASVFDLNKSPDQNTDKYVVHLNVKYAALVYLILGCLKHTDLVKCVLLMLLHLMDSNKDDLVNIYLMIVDSFCDTVRQMCLSQWCNKMPWIIKFMDVTFGMKKKNPRSLDC